jgi:anaerobic magnesium-protoporphyrin IX monomethyl ester cyclase
MEEKIDFCFVNPPGRATSTTIPIAFLYLHAWLRKNDIDSKLIDIKMRASGLSNLSMTKKQKSLVVNQIILKIRSIKPSLIGIPCFTPEFWDVISLCEKIKKENDCKIVIGGHHASIQPKDFFYKNSPVDYVIPGDGQEPLVNLINNFGKEGILKNIPGLLLPSTENIDEKKEGITFKKLHEMPMPDYSQIDMDFYTKPHTGIARYIYASGVHIFTALGCPFSCSFCANQNTPVGYRPMSQVLDELELLKNKYQIDAFYILDDTFLLKKDRVIEFLVGLKERNLNLIWAMETRVDGFDEEIAQLLVDSKCIQVDFGVESGSQDSLLRMEKGTDINQIYKAFEICKKFNLRSYANFQLNTPGETEDDVKTTLEVINKINPTRLGLSLTVPFPGTTLYDRHVKPPLKKEEYEIYNTEYIYIANNSDPRFVLANHNLNLPELRFKTVLKVNGLRNIMDLTTNLRYWKVLLKSQRKWQYLASFLRGLFRTILSKSIRIFNIVLRSDQLFENQRPG